MVCFQRVLKSSCDFCKVASDELKSCVCKKVSYCGKVCQKADWKKHKPSCHLYTIREVPFKRIGVFATRKINKGEKIMEELPLLALRVGMGVNEFRTRHYPNIDEDTKKKIFKLYDPADNIKALNKKQFEAWKGNDRFWDVFSKSDNASRTLRIFALTCFPVWAEGRAEGLYHEISFLNHSCIPNADESLVKEEMPLLALRAGRDLQRKRVLALKTIEKNEEILINFIGKRDEFINGTKEFRRKTLLERLGFLCLCSVCLEGKTPKPLENIGVLANDQNILQQRRIMAQAKK